MTHLDSKPKSSLSLYKNAPTSSLQTLEIHHLSHDLRGPLNSILGFSELLLEGIEGPLNETQTEDIKAIYQSAQNLLLLINNVVDISKIETNMINFEVGPVDLNRILQKVSGFEFGAAKPASLELVIEPAAPALTLWGDAGRIEQTILNLVRFAFEVKRSGQIKIAATGDGGHGLIRLDIGGAAIPSEELDHLFELVVHIDPTGRSELGPGGLELPLAHRLAESQAGRIWVENNETGILLYLELPCYNDDVDKIKE